MKKKIFIIVGIVLLSLTFWAYIILFVLTGIGTSFARACRSVEVGMPKQEALFKMRKYSNDNGVEFSTSTVSSTTEGLSYVNTEESLSATYQCYIFIDSENKVTSVLDIFD